MTKLLVILALLPCSASAAIILNDAPVGPLSFDSRPLADTWATGNIIGSPAGATNESELDTRVNRIGARPVTSESVSTELPVDGAAALSQADTFRWNSVNQNLESNSTEITATLLKATLQNAGTNYITAFSMNFDLTHVGTGIEEVNGLRVYWSGTGANGSWNPLGTFGTAGPVTASFSGLGTSFGHNPFYVLFADDNGPQSLPTVEHNFTIDNVTVTPTAFGGPVPEPSTIAMLGLGMIGLFSQRIGKLLRHDA
jgi:hypothetical protein